jgi:hypothetical protein
MVFLLLFLFFLSILIYLLYYKNQEGFNNPFTRINPNTQAYPWLEKYKTWRKEYINRRTTLCPLYTQINILITTLNTVVSPLVDIGSAGSTGSIDAVVDDTPTPLISGGNLPICDDNKLIPPNSSSLDEILLFFSTLPEDAETIQFDILKIVNELITKQVNTLSTALNPVRPGSGSGSGSASGSASEVMSAEPGSFAPVGALGPVPETDAKSKPISNSTTEGFFVGLCSAALKKEKQLIADAQSCKDISQLSEYEKQKLIASILEIHIGALTKTSKFTELLKDSQVKLAYLNSVKNAAIDGTLPMPQVI